MKLLAGEVWQVSKRNSQYFRSYLRKTTVGGLCPPPLPAGRGLTAISPAEEKLNFGGRWVWVPLNPIPPPQSKLRDDPLAYGYLILSGTASRQVASSGGGMWRQLPVRDDIGDATEPKLARPAAVEGGPTQRTA